MVLQFRLTKRGRQCEGKTRIAARKAAKAEAKRLSNLLGYKMEFYLCPWCKLWHTGSGAGSPLKNTEYPKIKRKE